MNRPSVKGNLLTALRRSKVIPYSFIIQSNSVQRIAKLGEIFRADDGDCIDGI